MSQARPFVVVPALSAVSIAYRNPSMIADLVLPRVTVPLEQFKYRKWDLRLGFTVPDTKVGRKSAPNQVEAGYTETSDFVLDYGLDEPIPQSDIDNAPPGYDPKARSVEWLTNLIGLGREVRASTLVFGTGTYAAPNKTTLSGTGQWSDFVNSDPVGACLAAFDGMVMRPNIGVMGQATWTKFRTHPKVVSAILGNAGSVGVVSVEAVRQLLELEALYIGQSFVNSAKKGQAASLSRAWGKSAAFIYRDALADAGRGTTFGFTAQFGNKVAGEIIDPDMGLKGGTRVRTGEQVKELVTANDLGYLFDAAVA